MIPLHIRTEVEGADEDFVVRVGSGTRASELDGQWANETDSILTLGKARVRLAPSLRPQIAGDVLLVRPSSHIAHRLIRATSDSNFFLVTEQCDQMCVMCSQPPKKTHLDRFLYFEAAALLAPDNCRITITGGEPTLHKLALFNLITAVRLARPDVTFHVLSNGQHFIEEDISFLRSKAGEGASWGIPLYSSDPELHDEIVGKKGAFEALLQGLAILCRSGAAVELRTVVMQANIDALPRTARFVAANIPFAVPWAIMQLENIGFAKNRWKELFFDSSAEFAAIGEALEIARMAGVPAKLYNFPLCTVPAPYRRFAPSTISDWKRRYTTDCEGCPIRAHCGGFFQWYPDDAGFGRIGLK